jgi:hypothetical protein
MKQIIAMITIMAALTGVAQAATQAVYYVDPALGSDSNIGTLAAPFQTLAMARDSVRTINSSMTGDIVVYLRGGIYSLSETLTLDEQDSGNNGFRVIYRNYPYEEPIMDGGTQISGWTAVSNGIYSASAEGLVFNQLYVNNRPAQRARYPEHGSPYEIIANTDTAQQIRINVDEIENWSNLNRVQMVIASSFTSCRLRIDSFTTTDTEAIVTPMDPERAAYWGWLDGPLDGTPSYYFENHFSFLDNPGEWFLDIDTDTVYYMPRADEDMSTVNVFVPQLEQLLSVEDAEDVTLFGITFQHAAWLDPMSQGMVQRQGSMQVLATQDADTDEWSTKQYNVVPVATYFKGIKNMRIERCVFTKMGSAGMGFDTGTSNNIVVGNVFSEIAESGIIYDMDNNRNASGDDLSTLDTFDSNYFFRIGTLYFGGTGLFAFWPDQITIANNEFSQITGLGMNVGWGATADATATKAPIIEYNRIHDTSTRALDSGGIHTKSNLQGAEINENWIYNITKRSWWDTGPERYSHGIYLDDESQNANVSSNVFMNINDTDIQIKGAGHTFVTNGFDTVHQSIRDESGIRSDYVDIKAFWRGGAIGRDLEPADAYTNAVVTLGTLFEDDFTDSTQLTNYTSTVSGDSTISIVSVSDGSVRLTDKDTDNVGVTLTRAMEEQSGEMACEFRVKAGQTTNSLFCVANDADGKQACQIGFSGAGTLRYKYQSDEFTDIQSYSVGTWYTFRIEADVEKQTYSLWIDDELVLADSLFFEPTDDLTSLEIYNSFKTGYFDIDYIKLESETVASGSFTSNGTSYTWLDEYYDTTDWTDADYEAIDISDEDGDGVTVWEEYLAGTVPTDDASALSIAYLSSSTNLLSFAWKSQRDYIYSVQSSTNLLDDSWGNVADDEYVGMNGHGGLLEFLSSSTNTHCFYRVSVGESE